MPRKPSFRRDTDLQKEVRRVNKLVQNKESRIRKNKGLEVQGVETHKFKEFGSRREIERYLKEANKFLDKKADFRVKNEQGAELQYSSIKEAEKIINRVNRQKKKQWDSVKHLEYKHKGVPTGLTVEQQADPVVGMGDPKFAAFKPLKFNPQRFRSNKELNDYVYEKNTIYDKGWLERKNDLYKENYIKSMKNQLGSLSQHLQDHIENLPMKDFIEMYYTENNAHIDFVYDKLGIMTRVMELEKVWGYKNEELRS